MKRDIDLLRKILFKIEEVYKPGQGFLFGLKVEGYDMVIGVEGERETLLDWLRSLEMIDEENMKSYEEAMTEQSCPRHQMPGIKAAT